MQKLNSKNKKIIIISSILVFILLASVLCFKFLYLPSEFDEGINDDPRFMISYWDYDNFIYKDGDTIMPFRLKSPKNVDENKTYPLAIFLHGGGSHGMDNIKQMCGFYLSNIKKYGEECYVLMPQVSDKSRGWDTDMINTLEKVIDEYLIPNYKIDSNRQYLSGSSMGGYGTIQALSQSPTRYAAAMFDSGGIPTISDEDESLIYIDYSVLKDVPMLISHGRLDQAVPIDSIISFTDNLTKHGATDVTLRVYEDRGHDTTDLFYYEKENWEWLFKQSR